MIFNGLKLEAAQEITHYDVLTALQEVDEAIVMHIDLDLNSNKERKALINNPVNFLVKKMNNSEVAFRSCPKPFANASTTTSSRTPTAVEEFSRPVGS